MSDDSSRIDQVRQELESKLKGYEHPTDMARPVSAYSIYNEKGDDVYVTHSYDPYATFTGNMVDGKEGKSKNRPIYCPVCGKKASYECGCDLLDVMCENGHCWYTDLKGIVVTGDPHDDS